MIYHTVGVVFLADKMASRVKRELHGIYDKLNYDYVQIIRLAALFHDVGHMFMSHVSEFYYTKEESGSRYEEIKNALRRSYYRKCFRLQ